MGSASRLRPTTAAAAFGGLIGLAVGCAYLGGIAAKTTNTRIQAERIAGISAAGHTDEALSAAAGGLNASAMAIARRHDPYTVAGSAQRDRQSELLTARLESLRPTADQAGLRRISTGSNVPSVRPFQMSGALDASRDLECLTQAVYYEARGEGRDGMAAVAQVVLNRARHGAFPSTICGVVYQGSARATGCQFSFTCNGAMRRSVNQAAWRRAHAVASSALSGQVYAPVGTATHFHTTAVSPAWRHSLIQVTRVGSHMFYRFGGRGGSSGAFSYAAQPSAAEDMPRAIHASLNPSDTVRQAGQAVAYTVLWAQETLEAQAEPEARPETRQSDTRAAEVGVAPVAASMDTAAPARRQDRPASAPAA